MTSATTQINKPVLKEGAKGDTVKELQKLLLKYGVFVTLNAQGACVYGDEKSIDGVFGAKTTEAVKNFQSLKFMTRDGIVGNRTWRALYSGSPVDMPTLKKDSKGEIVKQAQERLAIGNFYTGKIDGEFGSKLETAVKALQKRNGLPEDGVIGDRTWNEIGKIMNIFC
ncbi:peptidoglycan-binding domain-containing protein [Calothrix sp. PCC 6303]|uniref:peptidoglycan-binding domain-containing protein n=1 Tax=Calothrix sp. PCC 6303 TaxID=1170562 RepID=UPI0002A023B4|nr:peptidoglycan-binding protein [Calothrix sp. PCC 6303]AFZ03372.1 Peptidoglycan-binding domain 1 protein [Calothrix sp. PCC 6303]